MLVPKKYFYLTTTILKNSLSLWTNIATVRRPDHIFLSLWVSVFIYHHSCLKPCISIKISMIMSKIYTSHITLYDLTTKGQKSYSAFWVFMKIRLLFLIFDLFWPFVSLSYRTHLICSIKGECPIHNNFNFHLFNKMLFIYDSVISVNNLTFYATFDEIESTFWEFRFYRILDFFNTFILNFVFYTIE